MTVRADSAEDRISRPGPSTSTNSLNLLDGDPDNTEQGPDSPMIVRSVGAGGFIRANATFRELVGYSETELAERPLVDWIEPADQARLRATLEGGEGCSVRHRTRSGDPLFLDIRSTDSGQDALVCGRRSTAPKPTEEARDEDSGDEASVRGTLETIARIVEEQNAGFKCSILLVVDGRFVRGAGPSLPEEYNAAIDGYAIGPAVGSCGTAIYWNVPVVVEDIQADPLWEPFAELAKTAGVAACWSHPFTGKTGSVLGALALYSPEPRAPTAEQLSRLRAAARMTGLAVERGRAEEALREKRKRELELEDQLRRAAKMEALGVLAGGVAHDFNNVLATILGNAEFVVELLPADAEVMPMLEDIIAASRRAGGFCQQMLAYAGRGKHTTSRIELHALLSELSGLVQAALSKKATLEYALNDEPIFIEGDENQLLQVVMNLVTNGAEALGEDAGQIVVSTELVQHGTDTHSVLDSDADLPAGEYVRLSVSDNGSGMGPETIARIFDPFFTTKFTGRGLGLATVQGIVHKHGGEIHLESKLGEGTTITITLPTVSRSKGDEPVSETVGATASRKRILVVDDEAGLRNILCRRLRHSGYDVVEAADGEQGINIFSEDPASFDCVLLDFSMPKRNGEEVHQEIRALRERVPIFMMSGFAEQEIVARFEGTDVSGFLQKPVPAADLLAAIRGALAD